MTPRMVGTDGVDVESFDRLRHWLWTGELTRKQLYERRSNAVHAPFEALEE